MANSEEIQATITQVAIQAATVVIRAMRQTHQPNHILAEESQKNTEDQDKPDQ